MLQNHCKTLGFKKNMVYEIPPGGEVNHIQPVAYLSFVQYNVQSIVHTLDIFSTEPSSFDILAFSETLLQSHIY